ncbi:MAG: hypothetical protein ACXW25_01875 [Rhodospirillales bacterium]
MAQDPITIEQARLFAVGWFLALDEHVPIERACSFLADDGLNMQFPDGDIRDYSSFKRWYDRVTHLFFDEIHAVHSVNGTFSGERAELRVVVGWQASWFEPPAAKSKRTSMNATQDWTVRRSAKNAYGLEIVTYNATAEPFAYAPGFARL